VIVLLVACADEDDDAIYGLAVAVFSLFLGVCGIFITFWKPDMHNAPVRRIPGIGVMTYGNDLSLLFLVWTTIGASILTFAGPFTYTGNGYFGHDPDPFRQSILELLSLQKMVLYPLWRHGDPIVFRYVSP